MPDTDKILEAEQSIQSMASELKRMRDAANLLQGSQSQLDAVLTSAQKVMQATEKFSGECGVVVTKLAATDLTQRLDGLQSLHAELELAVSALKETFQTSLGEFLPRVQSAYDLTTKVVSTASQQSHADFEQLAELLDKHINASNTAIAKVESQLENLANQLQSAANSSKARQSTMLVLLIINFVVALVILAKTLMPSLGG